MYIKTFLECKCFFSHCLHWYGFSLIWVLICVSRLLVLENTLSHWVQWYGFSRICVIICRSRLLFRGNAALHRVHWYDLSSVWVIIGLSRLLVIQNIFHTGCIDMVYSLYESSYVYQEYSYVKTLSLTGFIYRVFCHNELSYAGHDQLGILKNFWKMRLLWNYVVFLHWNPFRFNDFFDKPSSHWNHWYLVSSKMSTVIHHMNHFNFDFLSHLL